MEVIRLNAKYRVLSVFLFAMAVGFIGMQDRVINALLPFIPEGYQELFAIILALIILGLREVVKEYGQQMVDEDSVGK